MDGIINVYKEKGYTSHDVVAKMRGILQIKKIGHTGTLDPDAEGVLLVCVGRGTKLCDMLEDRTKTYRTVMLLGQTTDTQDVSGRVLESRPVDVTEEEVREAALSFLGPYLQVPPMYSALKVNGKKLYELARAGKEVERAARPVEILELTVDRVELPRVTMTVSCTKGTYIRTLCHDIGRKLGCGACMETLLRTRVGQFDVGDSLKLSDVEALWDAEMLDGFMCPVQDVFSSLPGIRAASDRADRLLKNGNPVNVQDGLLWDWSDTDGVPAYWQAAGMIAVRREDMCEDRTRRVRMYDGAGGFTGIYVWEEEKERFRPEKLFFIPGEN